MDLTWLSEQTGVAESTIKKHYGKFIHTRDRDDLELAKIEGAGGDAEAEAEVKAVGASGEFVDRFVNPASAPGKEPLKCKEWEASPTGFEPVLPT